MPLRDSLEDLPLLGNWMRHRYDREFAGNVDQNLFRGVYRSFEEAKVHLPATRPAGYDHQAAARMYRQNMNALREWDYPVLFWLEKLWPTLGTVFDYGGHVGFLWYTMTKYLPDNPAVRWLVYDVPAVLSEGRAIATQRGVNALDFTHDMYRASEADVFLASGSLQYFDRSLGETLALFEPQPRNIIVNMVPLHPHLEFVTINSMGTAFCPYKVFALDHFFSYFEENGWQVVDSWVNLGKKCVVPFHKAAAGTRYYGVYARRLPH